MTDLTKAEAVAALRSAAAWNRTEGEIARFDSQAVDDKYAEAAERYLSNAVILRALADAIEQAQVTKQDGEGCDCGRAGTPADGRYAYKIWIIPAPRLP